MASDSAARLFASVVGVLLLLGVAVWAGDGVAVTDEIAAADALPIERDTQPAPQGEGDSDAWLPAPSGAAHEGSATMELLETATFPVSGSAPKGTLVALRRDGVVDVLDFDAGVRRRAKTSAAAREIAVVGERLAISIDDADHALFLQDLELREAPVALPVPGPGWQPSRLLSATGVVAAWGRNDDGAWSGLEVRPLARGYRTRAVGPLHSSVVPIALTPDALIAETPGGTLFIRDGVDTTLPTDGVLVAAAGHRVVELVCERSPCEFQVRPSTGSDEPSSRFAVGARGVIADLVHARGVPDPTGQRVAVTLQLRYDAGRRPAVLHLDTGRVEFLPAVLPPDVPSTAYAWAPDGEWVFMPLHGQVLAWSVDDRVRTFGLGPGDAITDLAAG